MNIEQYTHCKKQAGLARWRPLLKHRNADVRFLALLIPALEHVYQTVRCSLVAPDLHTRISEARLAALIRRDAIALFLPMIVKCCVLEMHKLRLANALAGATPEERFDDFIQRCHTKEFLALFLSRYPVLNQGLAIKVQHYQQAILSFFAHLAEDMLDIEKHVLGSDLHRVTTMQAAGDSHRQCRRVFIIKGYNKTGQPLRFMYKPRSISNEVLFAKLCHWYNETQKIAVLKTPVLLDKHDHGYCEFITHKACDYETDLSCFYATLGQLTALLLIIDGKDIHAENIIARGKEPVLIDLECILSPVLMFDSKKPSYVGQMSILPRQSSVTKKNEDHSLPALSNSKHQQISCVIPVWHMPGTDVMYLVREEKKFKILTNTPYISGKKTPPIETFQSDFIRGFETAYVRLQQNRDYLLADKSPLFGSSVVATRYLFRSTADYAILLFESYHPLILIDSNAYQKYIDWLNEIMPYKPYAGAIIAAEKQDILAGDIPYFSSPYKKKSLFDSYGKDLNLSIARSGAEQCRLTLGQLSQKHLSAQKRAINLSFLAYEWNNLSGDKLRKKRLLRIDNQKKSVNAWVQSLVNSAIDYEDTITWIQLAHDAHQSFICELSDISFYKGSMGVAFVLAYWDRYYNCASSRKLVCKIVDNAVQACTDKPALGFGLNGLAGLLYAAHHIAVCGYPVANELVHILMRRAKTMPLHHDTEFDAMSGISHNITTLLHFENVYSIDIKIIHDSMQYLKEKCPNPDSFHLDKTSVFQDGSPHPPNLGYAHGISGVANAFLRYAKRFNDKEALFWVKQTLDLLDNYWCPHGHYWQGKVTISQKLTPLPLAWCTGHTGIGFFYLACYMHCSGFKKRALQGIERCVTLSTQSIYDKGQLPSLCCGFYGELDFLLNVNKYIPDNSFPGITEKIKQLANQVHSRGVETDVVNLFQGTPSYLYLLMRHAHPNTMPCALYW